MVKLCPGGAALVTEERLAQANVALFTLERIADKALRLNDATKVARSALDEMDEERVARGAGSRDLDAGTPRGLGPVLPTAAAGAYALGFTLDTVNSLAKLLRTNRQLDVFSADAEAGQILGYLLESKSRTFIANPALLGDRAMKLAESLLATLGELGECVRSGNDTLSKIKKRSEAIMRDHANDLAWTARIPTEADLSFLKGEIDAATSLLDSVHPVKKPDTFWAQVTGQVIAENIKGKPRLFLESKAQTVQVTESRWYTSDRILATGEVQVAYRFVKPDGSIVQSGVILKVSGTENARIDQLEAFEWPER